MSPRFRTPSIADGARLTALGRTTFLETFGHLYRPEDIEPFLEKVFGPAGLPAQLGDPRFEFRVADVDGELIAYAKLGPLFVPADPGSRRALELRQLYVLAPWHGKHVADELMQWALDRARARGAQDLYLSVYAENWRAQRFYQRYGFVEVGAYRFMVGDHADDERIMCKPLDAGAPAPPRPGAARPGAARP